MNPSWPPSARNGIRFKNRTFHLTENAAGGNCLFHSIVGSGKLMIKDHLVLRQTTFDDLTSDFVTAKQKFYYALRENDLMSTSFLVYCQRYRESGIWCSNIEV